ncbi:MAG: response regulator transcription factor [Lachnospiraceae bacterium]|nr:response regulator transcription factor [Lachnospiraceae bacterium]
MNILIQGQDENWTKQLKELCEKDKIYIYSGKSTQKTIQLLVTDFSANIIRKGMDKNIPFLIISKEDREERILEAFRKGAEDYMIYPVSPRIAKARICGILKRYYKTDVNLNDVYKNIQFTENEYKILDTMMHYPGKVFTRMELIEAALPEYYEGFDRNIDNYIKQIRQKIKAKTGEKAPIETIYGLGYRYRK